MHDPDDLPGLAHFLEHMLFLGTEKYPNENDFSQVPPCPHTHTLPTLMS